MALHTLKELHNRTADQIRALVQEGYRITPDKFVGPYSENIFKAYLVKDDFTIELYSREADDTFIKCYIIKNDNYRAYDHDECFFYYKVHDDIYADTKLEADNERVKWYAHCLGVDPESKNPWQAFSDKLCREITNHSFGDK